MSLAFTTTTDPIIRHTAASQMLNHGISPLVVARILGHSNLSVTLTIYAHTTFDMQNNAASIMDEIVTPIPVELNSIDEPAKSIKN